MTVTDSSPLIAFERVGRLDLLPTTLGVVLAPPAVVREFGSRPSWLRERPVENRPLVLALLGRLHRGEAEAIALAAESRAVAVLDERRARRVAADLGVPVIGTVGVLLRAKRQGRLEAVRPVLDALDAAGFRVATALRDEALRRAGEAPP